MLDTQQQKRQTVFLYSRSFKHSACEMPFSKTKENLFKCDPI